METSAFVVVWAEGQVAWKSLSQLAWEVGPVLWD